MQITGKKNLVSAYKTFELLQFNKNNNGNRYFLTIVKFKLAFRKKSKCPFTVGVNVNLHTYYQTIVCNVTSDYNID